MTTLITHKRVEFSELFFDLVFVYAISKTTSLIHHLHHGMLEWNAFSAFLFSLIVLVNIWMVQTVFTNRYGKNSLFNMLVTFISMGLLLFVSNMMVSDWYPYFHPFSRAIALLSVTQFVQYLVEYKKSSSSPEDKQLIRSFLVATGVRTVFTGLAGFLPLSLGLPFYTIGILLTWVFPIFVRGRLEIVPINFPHLIERISLLVIITFGEMIMGIAAYFTPEAFSSHSILYLAIVCLLFLYYFTEFDHAIDESNQANETFLIYSHYPIFMGLIMITVALTFVSQAEANHLFSILFLYAGLALFIFAIHANSRHNKAHLVFPLSYIVLDLVLFALMLGVSLVFRENATAVLSVTALFVLSVFIHFVLFYIKRANQEDVFGWELY
ncbi:low temperature requirement protein A [Streptococcus sp. DD12]|uniref:low temperature requirement protein A n=1 Tax=Streptococcus sp. DD12 TaxID=1777880 RepID=UPI000793B6A8|nr:low temperature requirement protein A [Streptococcus sp. DD12]KXT75508.1 hypothetical protein STRDD12_01319 [Streptococcus sp. DD12]